MRFFAHDGKATHGPAGIEELLKLPGFDGDTLVCPVGSDDSADWKPALAYPPFKKALLEAPVAAAAPAPAPPPPAPLVSPLSPMLLPGAPALSALPPVSVLPPMPMMAPMPAPIAPAPPPAPAPKTVPCPSCAHANLQEARFCNSCGARMDGKAEDISAAPEPLPPVPVFPAPVPPAPVPPPAPVLPHAPVLPPALVAPPAPVAPPEESPSFERTKDPFADLDPLRTFPEEPAALPDSPRRPLQPGKMGQLAEFEASEPALSFSPAPDPSPLAPEPAAAAAPAPVWKRPPVLAGFAAAAALATGLGYMMLGGAPAAPPAEPVAELTPSAPPPAPEEAAPPAPAIYSPPPQTSSPAMPPPAAAKPKRPARKPAPSLDSAPRPSAAKPKRRRSRPARKAPPPPPAEPTSGEGDTFIESRAPERTTAPADRDPLLEALLSDATKPSAEPAPAPAPKAAAKSPPSIGQRPAAAKPAQFSLPGLKRPVSASDRPAAAPAPGPTVAIAGLDAPLTEPGAASPPPGIEDEPAKPAGESPAEGDQLALVQVHEQFDFCAQLLAQGAYGDHFDTCLCKDARETAPYRGRRGFYVTAKEKDAGGGRLETSAKILSSKIDGGVATVTGRFSSGGADKGRTARQTWKLEDGLWCQAP